MYAQPHNNPGQNPNMMPNYGNPNPGQGQTLLQTNSFTIVPGQAQYPGQPAVDPNRYSVKDDSGYHLLVAVDTNGGINPAMRCLIVKDSAQVEVLRISYGMNTQVANLQGAGGHMIGNVLISAKPIKDHKKDHDGKRQVVLQSPSQQILLSMSGKSKHGVSMEMKIKSPNGSSMMASSAYPSMGAHSVDKKHKDKKDKDKKDKDKKDKKNKKKEVGEVSGNMATGFRVRLENYNLSLQERVNVVGLLIAYMELEKNGAGGLMSQFAPGMYSAQVQGGRPQPPPYQPGMGPPPTSPFNAGQVYGHGQVVPGPGQPFHAQMAPGHPTHMPQPGLPGPGFIGGAAPNPNPGFMANSGFQANPGQPRY